MSENFSLNCRFKRFNPREKYGMRKVSSKDFTMNKELVRKYEKMFSEFRCIWSKVRACVYDLNDKNFLARFEADEDTYILDDEFHLVSTPLRLNDGTYIFDDWERVKAHQKRHIESVKALYSSNEWEVDYNKYIGLEYAVLDTYKGSNELGREMADALNIIAKEFNTTWLPLLKKQGGSIACIDFEDGIERNSFAGVFAYYLYKVYTGLQVIAEQDYFKSECNIERIIHSQFKR